jgi:alkylated DNA repair dioxygenase AlkB
MTRTRTHTHTPHAQGKGVIGSLSLGAERRFILRHTATKAKLEFAMPSGSLMVMDGRTQESWQHAVPKQARVTQPRINLTFRIS